MEAINKAKPLNIADHLEEHKKRRFFKLLVGAGVLVFIFWSFYYLNIPLVRFLYMLGPIGHKFDQLFLWPDFGYINNVGMLQSIVQTFQMGIFGTFVGLALCVPLAWFASYNMTPNKWFLYPLGRGVIIGSRSIYELIWAILFTMILGFGPLAGSLTCVLATIGFSGKLMTEAVEAIDMGPVEAMRATGAGEIETFLWGVLPQVQISWTGISIYGWDSTFRMATIMGYVGAGGIGMYLRETIEMLEYEKTGMTLLVIIILVVISEVSSAYARNKLS
ncbi:MAG: phosphonate ABC transporter, permease protein PhnE [Desulfohalobiaceae bacterium]|nr:phosphonate ABC transporter, permease protein PhnE [Desulfohalobiaceae bacterium]